MDYNFVADNDIHLAVVVFVGFQIYEILRNSKRIWAYSRSRSSKVIDFGVNRKSICDFLLVINSNFGRISYPFRDWRLNLWNGLFSHLSLVWRPRSGGGALEFRNETYPAKTRGMGLPYGVNFITLTVLYDTPVRHTDGGTDGWTCGRTGDSM